MGMNLEAWSPRLSRRCSECWGKPCSSVPALPVGSRPVGTPQLPLVLQLSWRDGAGSEMGVSLGMLSLRRVGGWQVGCEPRFGGTREC